MPGMFHVKHLKTILKATFQGGGFGCTESHRTDHPDGMWGHKMDLVEQLRNTFGSRTKIKFTHQEEREFEVFEDGTWKELRRTVL